MAGYTYKGTQHRDPDPTRFPNCGTEAGYSRHKRRKETACTPCKNANAKATALRRGMNHTGRRRRPQPECGTRHGYTHHWKNGERPCFPCRVAESTYAADYRARKKANAA